MVPPLLLIAALAIPASVFFSMGYRMAYSMGRTGLMLRAGIIDLLLFGPMLYLVWSWGVIGIAIAWVFSKYLSAALILSGIWRDIDPPTLPLVGRLAGLLLTAVASGFLMSWTDGWLVEHVPALPLLARFILVSILGVLTYTSIVLLTQRSLVVGAMNLSRGATPQPALPTDPAVPQAL